MRYQDAASFRTALQDRLKLTAALNGQKWLLRHRKLIVFDRLLARLVVAAPGRWALKGAVALGFRLHEQARPTMDLDLGRQDAEPAATDDFFLAQAVDLDDFFTFEIERTGALDVLRDATAVRYRVLAQLDGRRFEIVTVDVGFGQHTDPITDFVQGPALLDFAGIPPTVAPTISLEQHIAEKLHAYTRIYGEKQSSRVKHLVDFVLISRFTTLDAAKLRHAIARTFATRYPNPVPDNLPAPPENWTIPYQSLAIEVSLTPNIEAGFAEAAAFLNPILSGATPDSATWHPEQGE